MKAERVCSTNAANKRIQPSFTDSSTEQHNLTDPWNFLPSKPYTREKHKFIKLQVLFTVHIASFFLLWNWREQWKMKLNQPGGGGGWGAECSCKNWIFDSSEFLMEKTPVLCICNTPTAVLVLQKQTRISAFCFLQLLRFLFYFFLLQKSK